MAAIQFPRRFQRARDALYGRTFGSHPHEFACGGRCGHSTVRARQPLQHLDCGPHRWRLCSDWLPLHWIYYICCTKPRNSYWRLTYEHHH